jgi:hypothetical protein
VKPICNAELSKENGISLGVSREDLVSLITEVNADLLKPKKIWEEKE